MARIRTIKPEFWMDEDLASLSAETRLLAIGLLNMADDEGFFKAHPMLVKSSIFPYNDNSLNVQGMLNELCKIGYVSLIEGSDGKQYGHVKKFTIHQRVNRPQASKIRGLCAVTYDSWNIHGTINDGKEQGKERKGKEEEGKAPHSSHNFLDMKDYIIANKRTGSGLHRKFSYETTYVSITDKGFPYYNNETGRNLNKQESDTFYKTMLNDEVAVADAMGQG